MRIDTIDRGILLRIVLGAAALIFCAVAAMFGMYLMHAGDGRDDGGLRVAAGSIPADGYRELQWKGLRVFLVRDGTLRAWSIPHFPYQAGVYGLPAPTWERPFTYCSRFVFQSGEFQCTDADWRAEARQAYRWDARGRPLGAGGLPPLQEFPFTLAGDEVVIGR